MLNDEARTFKNFLSIPSSLKLRHIDHEEFCIWFYKKKEKKKKTKELSNRSGRVIALDRPRALIENRARKKERKKKTIIDQFSPWVVSIGLTTSR